MNQARPTDQKEPDHWLDKIPWHIAPLAVVIGIIPIDQPHLLEKISMLFTGTLVKPIDIFDLLMHGTLPLLFILKAVRHFTRSTT
ncbi:MAG: RND transporter [Magnetococcales bacterium]|nr:RND transporter [Magnetococcales bacterium]